MDSHEPHSHDAKVLWREARSSVAAGLLVLIGLAGVIAVYVTVFLPPLKEEEQQILVTNFPPTGLENVILLRDVLVGYARTYPIAVMVGLVMTYISMQTFAIPGTASLSLLSGALYGSVNAFILIALVSTLGSTCCYCLSWLFGRPVAHAVWKEKLDNFRDQVALRRADLLNYLIFLRVTPILPNTFINVASPIVGVPIQHFMLATLVGCLPNNLAVTYTGAHLAEMDSLSDLYSPRILLLGLATGVAALAPVVWKHRNDRRQRAAAAAPAKAQPPDAHRVRAKAA